MTVAEISESAAKSASAALRAERNRFVALAFCWADLLFELDAEEKVVFAAGATGPLVGGKPEELIGTPVADLIAPQDRSLAHEVLGIARKRGRIDNFSVRLKGTAGATAPLAITGHWLDDLGGHYFLAFRMGTGAAAKIGGANLSRDSESGLYDADSFAEVVKKRVASGIDADGDSKMTLIALPGYDELKGRLEGDSEQDLLNTVSACLRASSVDGDTAARIDDDRFGLVHNADLDVSELEKKISEFTREVDPTGAGIEVEAGTIAVSDANISEEDLANGLLYTINRFRSAKGGDFIKNLSSNLSGLVSEAGKSVTAFRQVVAQGNFDIAYQPIINTVTGEIHHYEALARFHADKKGESPYERITFAEETGLISEFDMAMVRKVVAWLANTPRYRVAVNMSGNSVLNLSYINELHLLLRNNAWAKDRLMFEITESGRIEDLVAANRFIQTLRREGYEVCLDDFGAGAANFEYISILEVDVIKIDGPALKTAQKTKRGRAYLRALAGMCRELGIGTIAEMIDNEQGLEFVRNCRVQYVQGYLFGKPSTDIRGFDRAVQPHMFPKRER
jgi:EAL domain-containing protein (putative c-di-GMP-specific phosphodiesterase class I)